MANALFDGGREGFLDGSIDWDTDTIKVVGTDSSYTPNLSTHRYLSDIPAGSRIQTSLALTSKTVLTGVADADDCLLSSCPGGKTINRLNIFKDTAVEGTSRLIGQIDTQAGGTNLAVPTGSGGDFLFRWDNGPNKIFKL